MSDGFANAYTARLLFETTPDVTGDRLLAALRRRCGRVEPMGENAASPFLFVHLDHTAVYTDKTVPVQTAIMTWTTEAALEDEPDLRQCWDWPQARSVVPRCRSFLAVADLMAITLDYKERLALFHDAVAAAMEVAPCQAIHGPASQRFVDPEAYIASKRQGADFDPIFPAVKVRLFNVENGIEGETLMDTVGLAALGLPDLQCHFVGLDVDAVARMLTNTATYVFDEGDVIEDGHTVQGLTATDRWRCQHEDAMIEPDRPVLDVDPGPPHAAGKRA